MNKETRGPNVAADKAAHDAQLEKEKEAAREKGEWRQKQRQEEEQRSKAKQTAAATAAPAAAATPTAAPARPENNLKSAESNEIYQGAASLWNGKGHAGDVSKLAASALDHAEQLEIGKFIKEVVALYSKFVPVYSFIRSAKCRLNEPNETQTPLLLEQTHRRSMPHVIRFRLRKRSHITATWHRRIPMTKTPYRNTRAPSTPSSHHSQQFKNKTTINVDSCALRRYRFQ